MQHPSRASGGHRSVFNATCPLIATIETPSAYWWGRSNVANVADRCRVEHHEIGLHAFP
jgi:hypothetical protein